MIKENQNRLVSIVVPVYQAGKYLEETILSVLSQTYKEWELLLVDDCSSDDSVRIMEKYATQYPNIRVIKQEKNKGAAAARNRGIDEMQGRFLSFLDADDIWLSQKLEKEIEYMERLGAAFVFCGYEFADEYAQGTGKIVHVPDTLHYEQALKNTTIFTTTVLFDTTRIPKGLLHMPYVKSEDTATWWQILRAGYTAYGLDENLVLYRRLPSTLSSNKWEAIKRIWYLYRKVEKLPFFSSTYNFVFYAVRAVLRRI